MVSVLVPTFRRHAPLVQALRSILQNGFEDLEVIVSDDDPGGCARAAVEEIRDARVRHSLHPGGPDKPRNWQHAARQARGEFVVKLDDDDEFRPGFIAKCAAFMHAHPEAGSVYTAFEEYDRATATATAIVDHDFFPSGGGVVPGPRYVRAILVNEGGFPRNQKTTAFFRREVAARFDFFALASDDFSFSAALGVETGVGYIPEVLYRWTKHEANSSADLHAVWRVARESLDGLARLPTVAGAPDLAADWPELIARCHQALPIYYLQASLRMHGRSATWKLWRKFREDPAMESPWRGWLVVGAGMLLPRSWHAHWVEWYIRSPWLQAMARTVLTSKRENPRSQPAP